MKRLFLILSILFCASMAQAQPFTPTPGRVTICTPDGIACSGMDGVMIAADTSPFVQTPGKVTICDPDGTNCSGLTGGGGGGGGLSSVSADAPLTGLGTSGNHLAIPAATGSVNGYLTSADWTTFNAKQSALTFTQSITNTAGTVKLTGDTASPGVSKYYGTDAGGSRGFFDIPSPGAGATTFTALTDAPSTYVGQADRFVKVNSGETALVFVAPPAGAGDVTSNTSTSVDSELALFSATSGKMIKRATGTGIAHLTSGVLSASTIATADIANNAVDFTKTQQIATARLLGRSTAGTGNIEQISLSGLSLASGVLSNAGVLSATGTASQVTVSASTGNVVFSLPATINVNTTGNAATATALAANPAPCGAGQFVTDLDANGTLTCGTPAGGGNVTGPGSAVNNHLVQFDGTSGTLIKDGLAVGSTNVASSVVQRDGSGNFTAGTITATLTGNASTATALAADPAACSAGQFVTDISANGTLTCQTPAGSGDVLGPATNTADFIPQWNGTNSKTLKNGLAVASANTVSAIVQRDASGNFSAGTITAALTGNVTGNASTATNIANNQGTATSVLHGNASGAPFFGTIDIADISAGAKHGTGSKIQTFTGAEPGTGAMAVFDANHILIDGGAPLAMAGSNMECLRNNAGAIGSITGCTSSGTNTIFADGTLRVTNPWIGTGIFDANGHTLFKFSPNAAAVVGFEFVTDATGNPATITLRPYGVTNANLVIAGIGTGSPCFTSCNGQGTLSIASITFNGATSGGITVQNPTAVTTPYNFNLPATAGTSGYFLTSAAGGSSPMTWTQNNFLTSVPAAPVPTPGTSITLTAPRGYAICTGTCTVTVPVPAAGNEFCVLNDNNVATAITLSALGSSAMYQNQARTAYGTAGTGTLSATAAAGNQVCLIGRDATHYLTVNAAGTWTAS